MHLQYMPNPEKTAIPSLNRKPRLLFFVTEDWYFAMHFLHFAVAAKNHGWEVALICNTGQKGEVAKSQIESAGVCVFPVKLSRASITPWEDFWIFCHLLKFIKIWKPDVIHAVALKPIVFSFFLSLMQKIPVISMMTGLGYVFTSSSLKARVIKPLLKIFMHFIFASRLNRLMVLNDEDARWAEIFFALAHKKVDVLPGVGIDTKKFSPGLRKDKCFTIAYVGRMLRDKGLFELIEAVKILKQKKINFKLRLAGAPDPSNPESICLNEITAWQNSGLCEYLGHISDVPGFLKDADLMVLPSYREGMPTSILEAASCCLPCIASDVPGCREAIINGITGLLVPVRNHELIADAIIKLALNENLRREMGKNAREMVLKSFSQQLVLAKMLKIYENVQPPEVLSPR